MAGLNQRIPHESRARLQDPSQRDQISGILGLDADSLTNADLQPLTGVFGGAGRVKKFRQVLPSHSNVPLPIEMESPALANLVNTTNQRQSQRNDGSSSTCRDADVENAAAPVQNTAVRGTRNESRGYPALARFIGSDTDFFLFRKFNTLCARRLLYLQDELMELEARLDEVDSAEVSSGGDRELWNLHSRREDNNSTRTALMAEISRKLQHYHEAMAAQARVLAMDAPPEFVIESVANWIDGMKPVVEKESHFLDCRDDLASLSAEHSSKEFLDNIIERKFYQYFVTKTQPTTSRANVQVEYYSTTAIRKVTRLLLCLVAVLFAVIPLPILLSFSSSTARLLIISSFAFGFGAVLAIATNSRNVEMFTSMAAYGAFLVVFLGASSS